MVYNGARHPRRHEKTASLSPYYVCTTHLVLMQQDDTRIYTASMIKCDGLHRSRNGLSKRRTLLCSAIFGLVTFIDDELVLLQFRSSRSNLLS